VWRGVLLSLCLGCLAGITSTRGQSFFLTLTRTPDPILLGNNIRYSLSVSNATGQNLSPGEIRSEYDTNLADLILATNRFNIITNILTNTPGLVIFEIPPNQFPINGVLDVFVELRGTNTGRLTNTFRVELDDEGRTEPAETNTVSEIVPRQADLGISILGPSDGIFPGDAFSYQLLASNAGPDGVSSVVVSNPFPANVSLVALTPEDTTELTNGVVVFSLESLRFGGSAIATVSVLATNATNFNEIRAQISAPFVTDPDPTNNAISTNIPILAPVLDQVVVTNLSAQVFNPQTGWMEQEVLLENISTSRVDSIRLLVDGLTNGLALINMTGTNGSTPYVAHGAALEGGDRLELLLEYFSPTRTAASIPDQTNLTAYGTPPLDLTPEEGPGVTVERIVLINFTNTPATNVVNNNGRILLEWPVTNPGPFQVIYDGNAGFTNAKGSSILVTAPASANRVQWLDYGPPRTLTAPHSATSRFYRVIQLP
jgi:uncharacterized repeat protein (TIGR01451 family)